jgi:uncharacterized protein (DUF1015 family)
MMQRTKAFRKGMDYVMMYFSNLSEKGGNITVLSTHRVVSDKGRFQKSKIHLKLRKDFHIENVPSIESLIKKLDGSKKKHVFGLYRGRKKFYLLTLKKTSPALKKLDVAILHDLLIDEILGIKNAESSIKYIRDEKVAVSLVDRGDYGLAFFLRPTAVSVMKAVAEKGEMMPQKSTYFYPKLLTGLVINKF